MRLLVWNIQRFTIKRVSDSTGRDAATQLNSQDRSAQCLGYIMSTVADTDPCAVRAARAS